MELEIIVFHKTNQKKDYILCAMKLYLFSTIDHITEVL